MALNLLKAAENAEHLKRHTDNGSLTVGSKALPGVDERQVTAMLKTFDNAYAELIAKEGNPGCRQFCLQCAAPVGTDAVIDKADLKKGAKPVLLTRDIGTPYEAQVQAVLIKPEDMPRTNLVYGIYGPYGPTGNAGIYTMIYGDPGMPFPKRTDENADAATLAKNAACKEYWDNHVFLCTPDEFKATVKQMESAGRDVSAQTAALLSFQIKGGVSPIKNHRALRPSKEAIPVFLPETKKTALQTELTDIAAHSNNSPTTLLRAKLQQKDR